MAVAPITAVMTPVRVGAVKRVSRRAKPDEVEEPVEDPAKPRRSNPPGVGENLDVTV
jgi:hypothetical protein